MVIKVYLSKVSGNLEIKRQQDQIVRVLQSKHIEFEEVDISDPLLEKEREFMRQHSTAKSGQKPLPPQVFADDKYCGDFDAFSLAIEDDQLLEFLEGVSSNDSDDDHEYEHLQIIPNVNKQTLNEEKKSIDVNENLLPTSDDV